MVVVVEEDVFIVFLFPPDAGEIMFIRSIASAVTAFKAGDDFEVGDVTTSVVSNKPFLLFCLSAAFDREGERRGAFRALEIEYICGKKKKIRFRASVSLVTQ